MNTEKILDIAVQADTTALKVYGELGARAFIAGNGIRPQFILKFAELLIKECGEVSVSGDPKYSAQHNIHKHFGVK